VAVLASSLTRSDRRQIGMIRLLTPLGNAWRVIEHRKLVVTSDHFQGQATTKDVPGREMWAL
jgi:hypothetical protein